MCNFVAKCDSLLFNTFILNLQRPNTPAKLNGYLNWLISIRFTKQVEKKRILTDPELHYTELQIIKTFRIRVVYIVMTRYTIKSKRNKRPYKKDWDGKDTTSNIFFTILGSQISIFNVTNFFIEFVLIFYYLCFLKSETYL